MTTAVYIGRFQPFHKGHEHVVKCALADHRIDKLIILVGSSNKARSSKNPWSYQERADMIKACFPEGNVEVRPCRDYMYPELEKEALWNEQVRSLIGKDCKYIVGYEKDDSSHYLHNFPELEFVGVSVYRENTLGQGLNATNIRKQYFNKFSTETIAGTIPLECLSIVEEQVINYPALQEEYYGLLKEKLDFQNYPYPASLNSCVSDNVVYKDGKVLLIKRGGVIGHGLYALAGGHKDNNETHLQAALKELVEETSINVDKETLQGCLVANKLFDHPNRNLGVTKPSQVFLFDLSSIETPVTVCADDDAMGTFWVDVRELSSLENLFHDDHYDIIQEMLKELK